MCFVFYSPQKNYFGNLYIDVFFVLKVLKEDKLLYSYVVVFSLQAWGGSLMPQETFDVDASASAGAAAWRLYRVK